MEPFYLVWTYELILIGIFGSVQCYCMLLLYLQPHFVEKKTLNPGQRPSNTWAAAWGRAAVQPVSRQQPAMQPVSNSPGPLHWLNNTTSSAVVKSIITDHLILRAGPGDQ